MRPYGRDDGLRTHRSPSVGRERTGIERGDRSPPTTGEPSCTQARPGREVLEDRSLFSGPRLLSLLSEKNERLWRGRFQSDTREGTGRRSDHGLQTGRRLLAVTPRIVVTCFPMRTARSDGAAADRVESAGGRIYPFFQHRD